MKLGIPSIWKIWPPTPESVARFDWPMKRAKKRINHPWHPVEIVGEPLDSNTLTPWGLTEETYQKHLKALEAEENQSRYLVDWEWDPANSANYNSLFRIDIERLQREWTMAKHLWNRTKEIHEAFTTSIGKFETK